ncbi:MAG TPA: hypothetical protein VJ343_01095 [archaeon]|nr:hypothetical protein [archaeon]
MIPENAHVTLYDSFKFYSGDANMLLGIVTTGYFWIEKSRIGIRSPRFLNHELLGLLICKAENLDQEDECRDSICYASPYSTNSGLCERHKLLVKSELAEKRIGLNVLIFPDSDLQKLKDGLNKTLEDFREKTSIDTYFNSIKVSKTKIRNGSWLIRKDGLEWILPPMNLDDVYNYNPTVVFSMYRIPRWDKKRYERTTEENRAILRQH